MTSKHSIAQWLGNEIKPLVGGIPKIAAANIKKGNSLQLGVLTFP